MALIRLVTASLTTVAVIVFWSLAVAPPVNSAIIGADADDALRAGEFDVAAEGFGLAVQKTPSNAINRLRLAQVFFEVSTREGDIERRLDFLEVAYGEVQRILERNPLDHRAWSRAGEFSREMAVVRNAIDQGASGGSVDDAVGDTSVLVNLMPGFWQARAALAWSYVRLGDFDRGLEAVQVSKDLAPTVTGTELLYYVEAAALEGQGKIDESIAAAERSLEVGFNSAAVDLLKRLHYVKAIALEGQGKIDEAIAAAERSLEVGYSSSAEELLQRLRPTPDDAP